MRILGRTLAGLTLALLIASPVLAQPPGGRGGRGGPGGFSGLMLLQNESVQKELKLDEEQVAQVKKKSAELREKHRGEFEKLRDLSSDERREKGRTLMSAVEEESRDAAREILKPEQRRRFFQISLQVNGPRALERPRVQEALKLTDEQKGKIRDILEDSREQMRKAFENGQGNREEARKKFGELRQQTQDKVNAVLTDEQKETWKKMSGEPFEFQFGPGGRRDGNEGSERKNEG